MGNIVSIDDTAISTDEIPDMSRQFSNPNTITRGTGSQASRVISVYIRVFVVSQPVHFIGLGLCDASCRIHSID
jgi:hypothetical protein